jgi:hypothetical protein
MIEYPTQSFVEIIYNFPKKEKKPYKLHMMSKCANIAKSHLLGFIVLSSQVRQRRSTFFFFFFFYEKS